MRISKAVLEYILFMLVGILLLALTYQQAVARGESFSWHVDCVTVDEDGGQRHVWVGYTASEDWTGGQFEYSGNGPGFYFDSFEPGEHDRVIDVLTDYGDVWIREDDSMSELTITSETTGPDCADGTGMQSGSLDIADNGLPNDPRTNPDANSCFSSGQVCTTAEEWTQGYYRIRESYQNME